MFLQNHLLILLVACCCNVKYTAASRVTVKDWIRVARCRANCFEEFVLPPNEDVKCASQPICYECWLICEDLLTNPLARKSLCDVTKSQLPCTDGCSSACDFTERMGETLAGASLHTEFPTSPSFTLPDSHTMMLTWPRPHTGDDITTPPRYVFLLFWRTEQSNHWKKALMTSDTSAEVKGPHSRYDNLQFRLMAITTEGVISQTRAFYPTAHDSDITNDTGILDEEANEGRTKFTNLATPYESKASPGSGLNDLSDKSDISRDNDENIRESIPPEITPEASTKLPKAEEVLDLGSPHIPTFWVEVEEHHGHLQGRLVWMDPSAALEANLDLIILWSLVSCDLGPEGQPCGLNDDTFAMAADMDEDGQVRPVLSHLAYNSRYWLEVRTTQDLSSGKIVLFETPSCDEVDATFTHCQQEHEESGPTTQPSTMPPWKWNYATDEDEDMEEDFERDGETSGPIIALYVIVCVVLAFSIAMGFVCFLDAKKTCALRAENDRRLHERVGNGNGVRRIYISNLDIQGPLPVKNYHITLETSRLDELQKLRMPTRSITTSPRPNGFVQESATEESRLPLTSS